LILHTSRFPLPRDVRVPASLKEKEIATEKEKKSCFATLRWSPE
jgi:hypothetical protein